MKKFIIEIDNDEIEKFGLEITLEDYFMNLFQEGRIEELPSYKIEELIN